MTSKWIITVGLVTLVGVAAIAEAGFNKLTLDWQDNANSEGSYRVERAPGSCSAGNVFTELAVLPPNTITYIDQPLAGGLIYCYRVRAEASGLFSDYSNTADGTTLGLPSGGPPTNLIVR